MSSFAKKWSIEAIIKFLEAYEQYPCLWNNKLSDYKDRNKRDEALRRIVRIMSDSVSNFDVNSAKAKIRSIRNAYTLEHNKVLKSHKTGSSTNDLYTPTLGWYSVADRFLNAIVETRETKNTLVSINLLNILKVNVKYYILSFCHGTFPGPTKYCEYLCLTASASLA